MKVKLACLLDWQLSAAMKALLAGACLLSQSQKQEWGKAHWSGGLCSSLKGCSFPSHSCWGEFNIPRKRQRHQVDACPTEQRSGCDIPSLSGLFVLGKHAFYGSLRAKYKRNYSSLAFQLLAASTVVLACGLFLNTQLIKQQVNEARLRRGD